MSGRMWFVYKRPPDKRRRCFYLGTVRGESLEAATVLARLVWPREGDPEEAHGALILKDFPVHGKELEIRKAAKGTKPQDNLLEVDL